MLKLYYKKWVILIVVIAFSFLIGARTYIGFFHLLSWFLIALLAVNAVWTILGYFGVRLHVIRKTLNHISEDDILEIEALVENKGFLPAFNVVLEDNLPCAASDERKKQTLIEFLGGETFVRLKYKCLCPLRGRYKLGPFFVYFFDPLGLFFLKRVHSNYSQVYVYPAVFNIKKFPELVKGVLPWFGIETARAGGDEDEFFGIREYEEGDPIRRIHWLSTARNNKLIVRQFQRQSFLRATVLFTLEKNKNFGTGKDTVAEYMIKVAASVVKHLLGRDISVELVAQAGEIAHIPFNKGPAHFEEILKFLCVAQAESSMTLSQLFEDYARYVPNDSTLVIIMLDKDWPYLPSMLQLAERNIAVVPVVFISSTFLYSFDKQEVVRDIKSKLSQFYDIKPILISCNDDLEEVFTS